MDERNTMTRAALGGIFGGSLALLTGSTIIGIALVAAVGAGLAARFGGRGGHQQTS